MSNNIQDNNWLYNALSPIVQFATHCHYNSFIVRGIENLPAEGAYIIAPCHQQALMEPLAVLCFAPKPPVFLARADIFAKPTFRAILTFLRILPVYRIRDGQSSLGHNKEIFDRSRDVLLDGYPLCLMAEGRHNNRHHLLNMGKGMFRIAGETQLQLGSHPLFIVPTGIDFDEYERPYSNLVVNIGKPIPVQPFMDGYRDNEPVALNLMRQALTDALIPLMHDIRDDKHYAEIMTLCNVLNKEMRRREGLKNNAWNRFLMRQKISRQMDSMIADGEPKAQVLTADASHLSALCRSLRLDEKMVSGHWHMPTTALSLVAVAAALVAAIIVPQARWIVLFCLLCHPLPLLPTHLIVKRLVADPQFRSSVNFGIRLVFSILYTIIIGIVIACTGGMWMSHIADIGAWWGLVSLALVFVLAPLTSHVVCFLRDMLANTRYWLLRLFRRKAMQDIINTYKTLKEEA